MPAPNPLQWQHQGAPEQFLLYNAALLAFGDLENSALFISDIDEFVVPRPPASYSVQVSEGRTDVKGSGENSSDGLPTDDNQPT